MTVSFNIAPIAKKPFDVSETFTSNTPKLPINVFSNEYRYDTMTKIADDYKKATGTDIFELVAQETKQENIFKKVGNFIKANKKSFAIGAGVVAGLTAIGLIAKKLLIIKIKNSHNKSS